MLEQFLKQSTEFLLPGGALLTLVAELLTPKVLYPSDVIGCHLWVSSGRQPLTMLEQLSYPLSHPCENALGIMVDGVPTTVLHVIVLLPLFLYALFHFAKNR